MWKRIREIVQKEFRQTLREPRMRILLFVPPLVQLLVFGYAVNLDVDHVRIAWFDRDQTSESRDLLAAFQGSPRVCRFWWTAATRTRPPSRPLTQAR